MTCETSVIEAWPGVGAPAATKITIVIADDHPIFRDGVCRLLSLEEDFTVVAEVDDGLRVLEALQQYEPDILLLDLNMPGLNGLATLERLRSVKSKTKVILLTASDDRNEFVQALKLGSAGIVQKQTATTLLIDSIRRVRAGEMWMDSRTTASVIQGFLSPADPGPAATSAPTKAQVRSRQPLSPREREIVHLTAQGFKNSDIASALTLSEQTVKNHLHNIFDKLGVTDRLELVLYAVANRLVGIA
ncbi:MAG: response regulator transcription factor [Acidobacteria bacterium]|nr:response regulator transcription factor [Acidobacteriota bacterium]